MKLRTEPQLRVEGAERLLRQSYDRIAPKYWRSRKPKSGWQLRVLRRFMRLLPAGGRVLDMGCGVGPVLKLMTDRGFAATGIDTSRRMLGFARRQAPGARLYQRDMVRPGFRAGSFDGVVSLFAVIHVHHSRQPEVFRQIRRLLTPRGVFLINLGDETTREYVGEHCGEWMYWSGVGIRESLGRIRRAGFRIVWKRGLGPPGDHHTWIIARRGSE